MKKEVNGIIKILGYANIIFYNFFLFLSTILLFYLQNDLKVHITKFFGCFPVTLSLMPLN